VGCCGGGLSPHPPREIGVVVVVVWGAMDLSEKERVEKAALRKRRQQGVAAGTSRFAELEQAVQEMRMNTLLV